MSDFAPETGSDGRPRPRYGEYASPEEQRRRIRQPDATDAISAGVAVNPPAPRAPQPGPHTPASQPSPTPAAATPAAGSARSVDRLVTVVLLAWGLFTVITTIPTVVDYGTYTASLLSALGADPSLADRVMGAGWGFGAALILGIGWLAAAILSWRNLRAGRITFWIPLVAGVVCNMISSILLAFPLMLDPTIGAAIQSGVEGFLTGSGS